jgi:sugar O-acyltransferase (sialic acid O-acetyltransferase NeuD family)
MENIIIIGSGGLSLEIVDLIDSINKINEQYKIVGLLDDNKTTYEISKYPILGTTSDISRYSNYSFVIAIANPKIREEFFHRLEGFKLKTPNLIHPKSEISKYAFIEKNSGIIINYQAQISALARIEKGVIIDSYSYIGHETSFNQFVTVYPGCQISGKCLIQSNSEIGLGSKIIQGLKIGKHTLIGAGSVVVKDIPGGKVAYGTPCEVIKENI